MKRNPFPVIAILDADLDDQIVLTRALEECRQDLRIHPFADGEELLDFLTRSGKYSKEGTETNLILVDLHLPGESGFELTEEIKSNPDLRHIPLIVLIGSSSDPEIRRYYELGTNTVITRPSLFDELVRILKTLCDYWFGPMRM